MTQGLTQKHIHFVIQYLLRNVSLLIDEKKTLRKMPQFITSAAWQLTLQNIVAVMPESGKNIQNMFQEQLLSQIPKLQKDTLMPNDLNEQKILLSSPQRLSPRSSCSSARKSINFSKINSIKLAEKLKSISMIEKKGSGTEKCKKQQLCSELNFQLNGEIENSEIQKLREKTQLRMQYHEEQAKLKQERQKYFKQQLKKFNQTTADDSPFNVTFDYDGDPMRRTLLDQEMRLHKINAGLGYSKRKNRDGLSKMNGPQLSNIEVSKKNRQRGQSSRALRPLDIPTFYMKNVQEYEVKKMKIQQYKKKFGRGYSRLGNQTIQSTTDQKTKEDLQIDKKTISQGIKHIVQNSNRTDLNRTSRKLALPRLHGKYKLLDRYEDN